MTGSPPEATDPWSIARAREHYNIDGWGAGYFGVNDLGHMVIAPSGLDGPTIDIMDVIEDIQERGLGFPCVIRFQDILRSRVVRLNEAFQDALAQHDYKGGYRGVFPVKVNQMREVIEEILDAGAPYHYGLEAGSKAELFPVLALNSDPNALSICNGYKDEDYMRLALIGRKLGRRAVVVIEKLSELPMLLRVADEMGVEPLIGFRAKLATKGVGKWEKSSGDFAKFGLTVPEIVAAVNLLRQAGRMKDLVLFHFHVGSQLTDIQVVKEAVREGARIYAKLRKMGAERLEYFDVGGGLGVDYAGARNTSPSSTNYSLEEYVADIVYNVQQICASEEVVEPTLVSESGRAVTAHHSCIIMNVFGSIEMGADSKVPAPPPGEDEIGADLVKDMRETVDGLTEANAMERFHDATAKKDEGLAAFRLGLVTLEERAAIEAMYWQLARRLGAMTESMSHVPEDLAELQTLLADQYLANFSLFQSALDHWAFDQLFPVAPVHRLNEEPTHQATLVDITCDSDGKIDRFVDPDGDVESIRLHTLRPHEPYFIGMFLTGAYQDIMGDMHNLFGRTNEVHVFVDDEDPEDFYLESIIPGDLVGDVLERVQYGPRDLVKNVKRAVDEMTRAGNLKPKEGVALVEYLQNQLAAYTYLIPTSANGVDRISADDVAALRSNGNGERADAAPPAPRPDGA